MDVTSLLYGEQGRTQVVEPLVRFTHLMGDGESLSAQIGIDIITGASPSGALPSGVVQTHTSASGRTITDPAGEIPLAPFHDHRLALEADWQKPLSRFVTSNLGGHYSREKDYQSLGADGKISIDVLRRLFTLTLGGGVSHDTVFPVGGTPLGLSDGSVVQSGSNAKDVSNVLLGVSRVLNRRWVVAINGTRTSERGYLTEPYKVISIMDAETGMPIAELTDKRPSTRARSSILFSSVYHLTDDVLHTSYRYYWDSWNVRSHTFDIKYRHDLRRRHLHRAADPLLPADRRELLHGRTRRRRSASRFRYQRLPARKAADHHHRSHARLPSRLQPRRVVDPRPVHPPGRQQLAAGSGGHSEELRPRPTDQHLRAGDRLFVRLLIGSRGDEGLTLAIRSDALNAGKYGWTLERADDYFVGTFEAMAGPCKVLVDTDDRAEAEEPARHRARGEARRIEQKFSRYRRDNIVHRDQPLQGEPIDVDDETALLLDYAATCYEMSDGMFDITSGVLRRIWTFDGGSRVPTRDAVRHCLRNVGWQRVEWESPTLRLPRGMEIDFGGIGKEYAVDRAAALIGCARRAVRTW